MTLFQYRHWVHLHLTAAGVIAVTSVAALATSFPRPVATDQTATRAWAQLAMLDGTPDAGDGLGTSVAISGNTVVASAPQSETNLGVVDLFVKPTNGWTNMTETAKLTASDGTIDDGFGLSVAISGNVVVVGAPYFNSGGNQFQGKAYVYVKPATGWRDMTETAQLTASDGVTDSELFSTVSISGNTIVAGEPGLSLIAYVFVKPTGGWKNMTETAKLTASDNPKKAGGYHAVAISGNTIIAGEPARVGKQTAVYLYVKPANGWSDMTQTAKLTPHFYGGEGRFGEALSISGNTVAVGAPGAEAGFRHTQPRGAVYVFVEPTGGWKDMTENATLFASTGTPADNFATSVSISGNTVVAGASLAQPTSGGTAYVFTRPRRGWPKKMTETAALTASDGQPNYFFGTSVSINAGTILIGAPGHPLYGRCYLLGR